MIDIQTIDLQVVIGSIHTSMIAPDTMVIDMGDHRVTHHNITIIDSNYTPHKQWQGYQDRNPHGFGKNSYNHQGNRGQNRGYHRNTNGYRRNNSNQPRNQSNNGYQQNYHNNNTPRELLLSNMSRFITQDGVKFSEKITRYSEFSRCLSRTVTAPTCLSTGDRCKDSMECQSDTSSDSLTHHENTYHR